jgi:hypothetical protein
VTKVNAKFVTTEYVKINAMNAKFVLVDGVHPNVTVATTVKMENV